MVRHEQDGHRHGHSHARPRPSRRWRALGLTVFLAAGSLFVTSYVNADGQDLRASSVTDLSTLVRAQRQDTDSQQTQVAQLNRQVNALSAGVDDATVSRFQRAIDKARGPSGMTRVSGAGVVVTMDDASKDVVNEAIEKGDPPADQLVVHQQDLQAVVNALWLGGARAISIMDQRIISTTGIKCAGPTVVLHGVPYSPPYVIKAVGDPTQLQAALDGSDYIDAYRQIADAYGLGYEVEQSYALSLPGYEGPLDLRYAKPLSKAG